MAFEFSGRRLAEARREAGLKRENLAVLTGRSFDSIRSYERGRITPPASVVARMASVLGCDPGQLFEDADALTGGAR